MNFLILHAHNANRGDEAAVKAMVDELLLLYPGSRVVISNNGETPYPCMADGVEQIHRFPKLGSQWAKLEFMMIYATGGRLAFSKEARNFLRILNTSDLVLHAPGGPSIGDIYQSGELLYLLRLRLMKKMKKPYVFYAPSMGPFQNEKRNKLREKVLRGAEKVYVRDPISLQYVKEFLPDLDVYQAMDSALQHDVDASVNEVKYQQYADLKSFVERHDKCIGITVTDLMWHPIYKTSGIKETIYDAFGAFIRQRVSEGYGIVFIPQLYGGGNDTVGMEPFMDGTHTFMVAANEEQYDTYFQQYVIGKLYAVIGMRYHSNIFAAKMGTPFVSVSYEQKMKGFMQLLDASQYCLDVKDLSAEKLEEKFALLVESRETYQKMLRDKHDFMKQESYKSTQMVAETLIKLS